MSDSAASGDHGHGHGEATYPYTPHHFHEADQHFQSGKMGIWLFLVTEILFFAGLFCAYTIYRAQYPQVFYWAHFYLDSTLGAANTVVLILSSLTAAWAVRNAQKGDIKWLKINIVLTIFGAIFFMCVKSVEYNHKYHDGLLPGRYFAPVHEVWQTPAFEKKYPGSAYAAAEITAALKARSGEPAPAPATAEHVEDDAHHGPAPVVLDERQLAFVAAAKASPLADDVWLESTLRNLSDDERHPLEMAGVIRKPADGPITFERPERAHIFFGIYFFMTGLHGVHVIIGIGLWIWMLTIVSRRRMGDQYFGPIDFTALYWHLVDLIWIYLFPMLYLIH
jgi:cytochrome c oxidase subunit 3